MDRGWCAGYMYQEQISTFFSVVATGMTYEMAMTSMPLQVLRLHLPHSPSSEAVVLLIFPKPQRYDTYVDGVFVPPANLNTSAAGYKLLPENPTHPQAFLPMLDNVRDGCVLCCVVLCCVWNVRNDCVLCCVGNIRNGCVLFCVV
ncbi:uncharacterized protein LOC135097120 [Scylla paramamosain]|uniref:uncharacterized protein LOC135097120 n=1 Tax=Scylla paramamosain TaxID=85552 RepID=UPI0030834693